MGVKGLQATLNLFRTYPKRLQDDILDAVEEVTLKIQRQAIQNAPGAGDRLLTEYGSQPNNTNFGQFIGAEFDNQGLTGRVFVEAGASELFIFVEFGTGRSYKEYEPSLPPEFREVARKYFKTGTGKLLKRPFLLPSYFQHSPELIKKVKIALESAKR